LLADEPTGQLDHATAHHILDTLLAVLDNTETALIVATHDLVVAGRMETVWQIQHGSLAEPVRC
jgi:putative ABC transport system ATP-binding protein/lipoprotein-releasing system ATP-binding protein